MNETGYQILKDRYSKSVGDDPTGFLRFIQQHYLRTLEEAFAYQDTIRSHVNTMRGAGRALAEISLIAGMRSPVGNCVKTSLFLPPFYKEALELARFLIANVEGFRFHCRPYVVTPEGNWENCYYVAQRVDRGEMPSLTEQEMDFAKGDALARARACKFNVYHWVKGGYSESPLWDGSINSSLMVSCCNMPQDLADKYTFNDTPVEIEYAI